VLAMALAMAQAEQAAVRAAVQAPATPHLESYNAFLRNVPAIISGQPPLEVRPFLFFLGGRSRCRWGEGKRQPAYPHPPSPPSICCPLLGRTECDLLVPLSAAEPHLYPLSSAARPRCHSQLFSAPLS